MRALLPIACFTAVSAAAGFVFAERTGTSAGSGVRASVLSLASASAGPSLAGTAKGIYRSEDGGISWKRVFGGLNGPVRELSPHPGDPDRWYAAVGSALFVSGDSGLTWKKLAGFSRPVFCVAAGPAGVILAGTATGIRISADGGKGWEPAGPALIGAVRSIRPGNVPGRWYALGDGGLFRTDDAGAGWDRVVVQVRTESDEDPETVSEEEPGLPPVGALETDLETGALFAGDDRGVLISWNAGDSWQRLPSAGLGSPPVLALLADAGSPGSVYAGTDRGLFYFSASAGCWSPIREGVPAGPVRSVRVHDAELWVGTDSGLFRVPRAGRPAPVAGAAALSEGPTIRQVQQAAIRYAEVMPEKISRWRAGAIWRNFLPKFTLSLDEDRDSTVVSSTSAGKTSFTVGPEDRSVGVGFGFTWDLANFVWNPDQTSIDTRSRLMVQLRQDLLEEVTRLYYERKRLEAEFGGNPTDDPVLERERLLRLEELAAQIDALTGGFFSNHGGQ